MKVAVQGASGFVGSRVVERLYLKGRADVVPVVRSNRSLTRPGRFGLPWQLADALDVDALTAAFAGCEVVFHCVAGDPALIVQSPAATVAAAARAGVRRVVYVSTGMTFGFNPHPATTDETSGDGDQRWSYANAKVKAAKDIDVLRAESGIEFVTMIPTIVWGPRSDSWTTDLARRLLAGSAYLVDDGRSICNSIYIDNLVDAMWLGGTVEAAANQDFIVGDRERVTWRELYQSVADAVGVDLSLVTPISRADVEALGIAGGWKSSLKGSLKSPLAKRVVGRVPAATKQRVRRMQAAWRPPADAPSPRNPLAYVSDEMLQIQVCDTQLPIAKAVRVLGFDPLPFAEGVRRTAAWLHSAGFVA